jgi:preprotein translocase subunit SecY
MNPGLRQKILITLGLLAVYRFLVYIPVPFVDIDLLAQQTIQAGEGLGYFVMLLGGTLDQFSILAVGLAPYINASIIMQLM